MDRPDPTGRAKECTIRPDPRSPYVLDTRELGRRPGSMRRVRRTVPAPEGLGTEVIGVPSGADVELDLRLEAVMEGVLVTGVVRGTAVGECVRCLGDVRIDLGVDLDVNLMELFAYPGRTPDGEDDDDVRELEADLIDLEPALRDAVVTAMPFQPVCAGDCPGLCSECGARLADDPEHRHESVDPRWAALQGILLDDDRRQDGDETFARPGSGRDDQKES